MTSGGSRGGEEFVAPAERALSFLSRSFKDAKLSADRDLKMMSARTQSFANSLDDWENIRIPTLPLGSGKEVSAGKLLRKIQDGSRALAVPASFEELEFVKTFKDVLPPRLAAQFRRSQSDPNFRQLEDRWRRVSGLGRSGKTGSDARRKRLQGQQFGEDWELLQKMREGLKEFESTAASSRSPTGFFENMKKSLRLPTPQEAAAMVAASAQKRKELEENAVKNVAPLDVPEVLENLVRQSEPLLDQLGVRKEVSTKVCEMIRSCCRKEDGPAVKGKMAVQGSALDAHCSGSGTDLDSRLACIAESTGYVHKGAIWGQQVVKGDSEDGRQNIAIVTTASLPWMTGTSVNPLFRAAYLSKDGQSKVTLLVPWLSLDDQEVLYPHKLRFDSPEEQEVYVRDWLSARVGFEPDFKIAFYPGKYSRDKRSIFAVGDIISFIPETGGLAVLEEPEHLTWYHHGGRWQDHFKRVVGIVHTNYLEYAKREKDGEFYAVLLEHVNKFLCKTYCQKVVRLSAATQELPKSTICNVHGVSPKFLDIGTRVAGSTTEGKRAFSRGAYFLGKMVWTKGYRELVDLLAKHRQELGGLKVDVYGSGDDQAEVRAEAHKLGLPIKFFQGRDHGDTSIQQYKVFINPSMSDVVCTTTAEALAMGKIVVCADHPSNEFFRAFPNCYMYSTPTEFVERVNQAMAAEPEPLSDEHRHALSWEAATERFLAQADEELVDKSSAAGPSAASSPAQRRRGGLSSSKSMPDLAASSVGVLPPLSISTIDWSDVVERGMWLAHHSIGLSEGIRLAGGAIPNTRFVGEQQCKEMGLPPPMVQRPIYGW